MKKILLLCLLILNLKSMASHLSGGWIETEVINSNTIKVRLKAITYCAGIPLGSSETVSIQSLSNGSLSPINQSLVFIDTMNIETYCQGVQTVCNSVFGTINGYRLWIYEGIVNLPAGFGSSIRIGYDLCCRPGNAVNIAATSYNYSMYTELYNLNTYKNDSPVKFSYDILASSGDTNAIAYSFVDLEADSLSYSLSSVLENTIPSITNCTYQLGFTPSNPLGINNYSNLDANTGTYYFYGPLAGDYAVGFEVLEYRNGTLLSKIQGEQVIQMVPSNINNQFLFSATGDTYKAFVPCQTDTVTYNAYFNAGDSIEISVDSMSYYSGAVLQVSNISPTQMQAQFIWQPSFSNISMKPDKIVFRISKYACPYLKRLTYITKYNVNSCGIDSVWPGDINLDKTVNLIDGIYLAAAYGDSGSARPNSSINWMAQYSPNWSSSFGSGANHKHADCDGNGLVDLLDAQAIAQNFNLTHAKTSGAQNNMSSSIYDPTITMGTPVGAYINATASVPLSIGDAVKKVLGANAVLFRVNSNPNVVDATTLQFTPQSGISNANDILITQYVNTSTGSIYIAFVKKNMGYFSGHGLMGNLTFKIKPNVSPGPATLSLDQPKLFAPNMYPMSVKAGPVKTFSVSLGLSNQRISNVGISPNPANTSVQITHSKTMQAFEIVDVTGKVILSKKCDGFSVNVNIENINKGLYFIKVISNSEIITSKLVKE
jgi:hypothetical protein